MSGRVSNLRRVTALADYLSEEASDYTPDVWLPPYGTQVSGPGRSEWLVMTDEEADNAARDYVAESLWAFVPQFLAGQTGIDVEVFYAIQRNDRCEDNNPAIRSIIDGTCGLDEFVSEAISADGRGHFLAQYDGEECELAHNLYAYRTN